MVLCVRYSVQRVSHAILVLLSVWKVFIMSFEEIIIELQRKPVLWKSSDPNYRNRVIKTKLWRELAMKLGVELNVLKKRWKHLKDQYRKELKKKPESRSGAEPHVWISPWKYFESMEFIRNELMPGSSSGSLNPMEVEGNSSKMIWNLPNKEDSTDIDIEIADSFAASPASQQSSAASTSHTRPNSGRKRQLEGRDDEDQSKIIKIMEKLVKESSEEDNLRNDADYLFLRSILPSMKKMSDYQKLCFRGKINDWLLEALAPSLNSGYLLRQ